MMKVRLFDWPASPFCMKVRAVLDDKSIEYEHINILGPALLEVRRHGRIGNAPAPGMSALTLFSDFQPLLGSLLFQSPLNNLTSEQRNALRSEPLLGDPHQLLERSFARIAKELDRPRRLSEPYPSWEVVNDAAPTRPQTARRQSSKPVVTALDRRPPKLPSEAADCPVVSARRLCG